MEAHEFLDLFQGERFPERKSGTSECPSYCKDKEQLKRCSAICECAFNREVIDIIKERQAQAVEAASIS